MQKREDMRALRKRLNKNQHLVFGAVTAQHRPVKAREVADWLGWDSASVTNRLSELVKKRRIQVAYRKQGLDGIWRNYYIVKR
jgi:predicted transcriptional regulator